MRPTILTAVTITVVTAVFACASHAKTEPAHSPKPGERHFGAIRQLTFGGENAEAYFSHDGKRLTYQATPGGQTCDQQFVMNVDGSRRAAACRPDSARRRAATSSTATARSSSARRTAPTRPVRPGPIRPRDTSGASTRTTSTPRTTTARTSSGSRTTASTRPKERSRPTGRRSSSRRSRTAISTSTRCASTAAT